MLSGNGLEDGVSGPLQQKKVPVFLLKPSQRYKGARRPVDVGFAPTEAERRPNLRPPAPPSAERSEGD